MRFLEIIVMKIATFFDNGLPYFKQTKYRLCLKLLSYGYGGSEFDLD